jgi:hypothetical protein
MESSQNENEICLNALNMENENLNNKFQTIQISIESLA